MSSTKQPRRYAHTPEAQLLAQAWDRAGPGTSSKIADMLAVSRPRAAQLRHGTTSVPPDAAEKIAGLLGVDPSRICAKYRITREFRKRGKAIGSFSTECKALCRAARDFNRNASGTGDFAFAAAATCGVTVQRVLAWLHGKMDVPARYAPKLAALVGLHPGQVSIEYLALHRFPTPPGTADTAPIVTGPMQPGEVLGVRPDDPMMQIIEPDYVNDRRRNRSASTPDALVQALTSATAKAMSALQATDSEAATRLMAEIRSKLDPRTLEALHAEMAGSQALAA